MKKAFLVSLVLILWVVKVSAQTLKSKNVTPSSKHYATLGKLSKMGINEVLDQQRFPLSEFRRMPYLKLATHYVKDSPESFNYPKPPANSSEQTQAELQYLWHLDSTRTSEDTALYLALADVYHDPFTFNPTDTDYDRNFASLFYVGKSLGSWYNYKDCPKTAMLLSKVIQDATYYVFSFKYAFSRPRPYQVEPQLHNLQTLGHASYPSGHSSMSWINAYVVEEFMPKLKQEFYENAAQLEYSREVIGVHYPSDGEAGRLWAREFVNRLFRSSAFLKDFRAAQIEINTFLKKK
ncbi:MAG: phosphatase PAP2 family protein [Leadbetterella sp.]